MNKTILLLLTLFVQTVAAETEYRPLVEEGKTWTTKTQNPYTMTTFFVSGDTIVGGECYKKVFWDYFSLAPGGKNLDHISSGLCCMLREDNKKVYIRRINETTSRLLYDFSLREGDIMNYTDKNLSIHSLLVNRIDTIEVKGMLFRRFMIHNLDGMKSSSSDNVWVEGIGSSAGFLNCCSSNMEAIVGPSKCYGKNIFFMDQDFYREPYGMYQSLLENEKVWVVNQTNEIDNNKIYVVKGDSILGGLRRMLYQVNATGEALVGVMQEKERKVFVCTEKDNFMLYDFGLSVGDSVDLSVMDITHYQVSKYQYGKVLSVDSVEINGKLLRRMEMSLREYKQENTKNIIVTNETSDYWIEGIGSVKGLLYPYNWLSQSNTSSTLLSCFDDDVVIYGDSKDNPVSVDVPSSYIHSPSIFDLQGRRLNAVPAKGLYIKNGKKFVSR